MKNQFPKMPSLLGIALTPALLGVFCTSSQAATYYVHDAQGSDSSTTPTNSATPWKTIAKVNSFTFAAGDVIRFAKGRTFYEQLVVPRSDLTFGSYGTGTQPTIHGSGTRDHCILMDGKDNININNLTLRNSKLATVLMKNGANNNVVEVCNLLDANSDNATTGAGVHMNTADGSVVRNCTLTNLKGDGIHVRRSKNVRLENNTINTVFQGAGPDNGSDCIQYSGAAMGDNQGFRITGNTLTMQGTDSGKGCIIVEYGTDGVVSGNNCSYGNYGVSVQGNNNIIEKNVCRFHSGQSGSAGLYVEFDEGGDLDNNTFRYNLVYNSNRGIQISLNVDRVTGVQYKRTNFKFYNNTIYGCTDRGVSIEAPTSGELKNNIVWCPTAANANVRVSRAISGATFTSNYNLINERYRTIDWLGSFHGTVSAFRNATGQDANSKGSSTSNFPLFVDIATNNFRIQDASPARNAGTSLSLTSDLANMSVPVGPAPDMGAYENRSTSTTTTTATSTSSY